MNNTGTITNSGAGTATTLITAGIGPNVIGVTENSTTSALTLSGANTYAGPTTISAGILAVSSLADGGTASNLGASTNAAANLVLNGGTLRYTGAAQTSRPALHPRHKPPAARSTPPAPAR